MSKSQDLHKPSLPFGNPFRMLLPKGGYHSPKLLEMLNQFEESLAVKLRKLKPANVEEMLSFPWMKSSMELLCEIHAQIKDIITELDLPANHWQDKWIEDYLVSGGKLLDICNGFSTEMIRLQHGRLFLQLAVKYLKGASSEEFVEANSSLREWRQTIAPRNPNIEKSFYVMDSLAENLDLPKIKKAAKGKVLMRAIYGVKVVSLLVCSILAATLSGSTKKLMDVQVSGKYKWAGAFTDLQTFVNAEIRNAIMNGTVVVKELRDVAVTVKKVYPYTEKGVVPIEDPVFQSSRDDFEKSVEIFSNEVHLVDQEVRRFFLTLLRGRGAMLTTITMMGCKCDADLLAHIRNGGECVKK